MRAATVELLVNKAHLEPNIALAFAEAIDMAMVDAQLVTVPILDTRFAELDTRLEARFAKIDARFETLEARMESRMSEVKAELVRWVLVVMLGNVALSAGATALLNALQHAH